MAPTPRQCGSKGNEYENHSTIARSADSSYRCFIEWLEQSGVQYEDDILTFPCNVRHTYCISVDTESLASIKAGPNPPEREIHGKTWINLINAFPDTDDPSLGHWMRVGPSNLAPRAYSILINHEWSDNWFPPPRVIRL